MNYKNGHKKLKKISGKIIVQISIVYDFIATYLILSDQKQINILNQTVKIITFKKLLFFDKKILYISTH